MRRNILILISTLFLQGAKSQLVPKWSNLNYAGDTLLGHTLDIFVPSTKANQFPVVVMIYGSAWFNNNGKGEIARDMVAKKLIQNGFMVIAINHRSSKEAKFPAQIQDVKAAIRFARGNAAKYKIDSSFIAITGWSSGGHLSALAGTSDYVKAKQVGDKSIDVEGRVGQYLASGSQVNAVVDWFGPTDFLVMDSCGSTVSHNDANSPESSLIGGPVQQNKELCALANPITYVDEKNPSFLIIHGDADPMVPLCESVLLNQALAAKGVQTELVVVPKGGHGPGVENDENAERLILFFQQELAKSRKNSTNGK
ncbi:MAG: alpha/beta hydrolase [Bacteroidetes bacterium]|nr:MAG: alpha/beta hydrolase [Bacteroidota bacterium]